MIAVIRNDFMALDYLARLGILPNRHEAMGAIFVRENTIIGAAAIDEIRERHDALMHVAGSGWTRRTLRIFFGWYFGLGFKRATAEIASDNAASIRLAEGIGFVREGVRRCGDKSGGDLVSFGLLRNECRYFQEV